MFRSLSLALIASFALAGCAEPPAARADPAQVARFLASQAPPPDLEIERKIDLDSAADAVGRAPAERSASILEQALRDAG